MRTNIFRSFTNLSKEFREDFDILWQLPEEQRLALIPRVFAISKAVTSTEIQELMEKTISEIGGDIPKLLRVLGLLRYISSEWNPLWDTPENFFQDIAELKLIPPEKAEEGKTFLLELLNGLQQDNVIRLNRMYAGSLLPNFVSITSIIDFRAVFDTVYIPTKDAVENYSPRCVSFVPVVIIKIARDELKPETFEFQCEPDTLKRVISQLQATLKELENAQSSLPRGAK